MASIRTLLTRSLFAATLSCVSATTFAAPVPINGGGVGIGYLAYLNEFTDLFKINSTFIFGNRAVTPPVTYFGSVGSTKAINAFLNNDYTLLNGGTVAPIASFGPGTTVHYGTTEVLLTAAQVTSYNSGSVGQASGPVIQIPAEGIAVAILFSDNGTTTLTLTDGDLCGIFSGKLTNWSQTSAAGTLPANPITVIYRNDGAGSTSLLTRHLGAVCTTGANGNSNIAFVATDFFASNFATLPATFLA